MPADPVAAYVDAAPEDQRPVLAHLRDKIRTHLPRATEQIGSSGFPIYTIDDRWIAGFATRKKGPMLYVMAGGVLDRHEATLGSLRSGRSCVEWRASKTLSLDDLDALADRMLAEAGA